MKQKDGFFVFVFGEKGTGPLSEREASGEQTHSGAAVKSSP